MVMTAAIAVFLAGLMVGRTPEFLGKKIGPAENKMIMLFALAAPLFTLPLTAIAVSTRLGLSGLTTNSGPHGFTEILFAYFLLCQQWPEPFRHIPFCSGSCSLPL